MSFFKRFRSNRRASGLGTETTKDMSDTKSSKVSPAASTKPFASLTSSDAAPPAYSYLPPPATSTAEDQYAFLSNFDTIFLIDDSGSMAGRSWLETSAALEAIAPICTAHDKDGIDIYFLNKLDSPAHRNLVHAADVQRLFRTVRPFGGTPTGTRLQAILKPYLQKLAAAKDSATTATTTIKPLNIIVVTDGVPSDDVESVIVHAARRLDQLDAAPWQVGIQFFQVGREPGAAEALEELDDGLVELGCSRDIVDTVAWKDKNGGGLSAEGMLKVVLGAVNRRLDRKRSSAEAMRVRRPERR